MPFSDEGVAVSVLLEKFRNSEDGFVDEAATIFARDHDSGLEATAPRIATSEKSVASGRADRGSAMGVCETNSFPGDAVKAGCRNLRFRVVGTSVTIALVIGHDEDDVRIFTRRGQR